MFYIPLVNKVAIELLVVMNVRDVPAMSESKVLLCVNTSTDAHHPRENVTIGCHKCTVSYKVLMHTLQWLCSQKVFLATKV